MPSPGALSGKPARQYAKDREDRERDMKLESKSIAMGAVAGSVILFSNRRGVPIPFAASTTTSVRG